MPRSSPALRSARLALVLGIPVLVIMLVASLASAAAPRTSRLSVSSTYRQGNSDSLNPDIAPFKDRFTAFQSVATNLVPNDTNGSSDIFMRDRRTGTTTRLSVSSSEEQGDNNSYNPAISGEGEFVAFESLAGNLVPPDTNPSADIFVRDVLNGTTTRVSVSSTGAQANNESFAPAISGDGRYVAFTSLASNLVPDDTNNLLDVFVHDRWTGTTVRASVSSAGVQGNGPSISPDLSHDGRWISFSSSASNLVARDTNGQPDVFLRSLSAGRTQRVSVSSSGEQGNASSGETSVSWRGRFVAFTSFASNLVPNDTNEDNDVFVRDRANGTTTRVSVSTTEEQAEGNGDSFSPSISFGGRYVAFESQADNFVPADNNLASDVFVRDRQAGVTILASVSSEGVEGNASSFNPSITGAGVYVAFGSLASNLVPRDTNGQFDVFQHGLGPR